MWGALTRPSTRVVKPGAVPAAVLAKALHVTPHTIGQWILRGDIKGFRLRNRGWWFVPVDELPEAMRRAALRSMSRVSRKRVAKPTTDHPAE